jgi:hypothetical protein
VAHIAGVIVTSEREVVFGFQPAVIGAAEFCKRSEFDHGIFPCLNFAGGAGRAMRSASAI